MRIHGWRAILAVPALATLLLACNVPVAASRCGPDNDVRVDVWPIGARARTGHPGSITDLSVRDDSAGATVWTVRAAKPFGVQELIFRETQPVLGPLQGMDTTALTVSPPAGELVLDPAHSYELRIDYSTWLPPLRVGISPHACQ
jgi:hypothetical protein